MPTYDNTNSGVLWKNSRKEKPTQPDFQGTIELGHDVLQDLSEKFKAKEKTEIRVSAWTKQKKDGENFYSLSIKKHVPKEKYQEQSQPENNTQQESSLHDDEIPF
tara:strand:+ start:60 stop:374 length:315 start_codon:yes stop_codon:yes gene_type:complete